MLVALDVEGEAGVGVGGEGGGVFAHADADAELEGGVHGIILSVTQYNEDTYLLII